MAANLPCEFAKYSRSCKHLRRILRETKHSSEEVEKSGYFTHDQLNHIRLEPQDEQKIQQITNQPVGIIILGQHCWAKSCIVNELFGQLLLPCLPAIADDCQNHLEWRMVRFTYGNFTQISLALPNSYELVEQLAAYEQPWHTVPSSDLELKESAQDDPALNSAVLEIRLHHPLLLNDVQVIVSSNSHRLSFEQIYNQCADNMTPILLYAIADDSLSDKEVADLTELKRLAPKTPVFFVRAKPPSCSELTESEQHAQFGLLNNRLYQQHEQPQQHWPRTQSLQESSPLQQYRRGRRPRHDSLDVRLHFTSLTLFQQLCGLGYLSLIPNDLKHRRQRRNSSSFEVDSELVENFDNFPSILLFIRHILQSLLVTATNLLNDMHNRSLRMFILTAFDMTWDMMITPKRLDYTRQREMELYESLMTIANRKQDEICQLIVETMNNMKESLLDQAANYEFQGVNLPQYGEPLSLRELQICTSEIQDLVLGQLNNAVAMKLVGSVEYLRESFVGTLERCLSSLENACREERDGFQASNSLKHILNAAYQVELTVKTSSSLLRVLWEKMKQLVQALPWKTPPRVEEEWKRKVASDMLASLSEWRLARSICSQFRERLKLSHDHFAASLRQLEAMHSGRLERTEELRLKVRKLHAPRIARFALESTSLRDLILFGMPQLGREIGRGQYGVVYSCDSWASYSPCAVKSVVPPDDKHWNDLAMEFYYTRSIPEHDRIVQIRGSVIDHSYAGGSTPAVLLIMERLHCDLYCAIKAGMDAMLRFQVALDVVQGIRFLHGQGLVHRDIKLKNVLLDKKFRAKITDLGFCKPEAMMSGSIVGTPIHMAPELFSGRYDNSVDVYAFGILFWYICAGHVRLPYVFEQCQTKDQLWNSVKRGARPERLPQFDDDCWMLMEECWATDPALRPLLGDVEPRLKAIMERSQNNPTQRPKSRRQEKTILSASRFLNKEFCSG